MTGFSKGNPWICVRDGCISLDATLTKMKRMLTAEDIVLSSGVSVLCTKSRLQIFVDAEKLSQARFKVIDHLLDLHA